MQSIDIGEVLTKSFACFQRHWLQFLCVVGILLLPALPANIYLLSQIETLEQLTQLDPKDPETGEKILGFMGFFVAIAFGILALQVCLQSLATSCLVYGTFEDLRHQKIDWGECFRVSLRRMPMIILLSILMAIALVVSFLFCCVPMIVVWVFLYLVIPVAVVENAGLGSFGRSIELTKGSFWPIFAIGLIFVVGIGMFGSGVTSQLFSLINPYAGVVVGWITGVVANTLTGIAQTVSYHDIRAAKEGLVDEELADIFD